MPEFHDRLEYLDERYEHLKRNVKALKQKMQELETQAILKTDHDEESGAIIREIIEKIKLEKQVLRDEAAVILGELNNATFKEEGRKLMTGEKRRAEEAAAARAKWEAEREEREAREAEERARRREQRLKEEEAERERSDRMREVEAQRAVAMDRLRNLHLYLGDMDARPCDTPPDLGHFAGGSSSSSICPLHGSSPLKVPGANGASTVVGNGQHKKGASTDELKRKESGGGVRCFGLKHLFGRRSSSSGSLARKKMELTTTNGDDIIHQTTTVLPTNGIHKTTTVLQRNGSLCLDGPLRPQPLETQF